MATEEDVVPSAEQVSDSFVAQYYRILTELPKEARRFYVDSSVVSRPGPDGTLISFNSVEAINEQFLSSGYENTTFDLLSVDSQASSEAGVFIMVIGFFTGKDNLKRKFSQMFYLARQNAKNYVVVNDMFRYVDEEPSTPKPLPVAESATVMAKPADVLNKTELIHKIDASVENSVNAVEVKNVVTGPTPPLDNGKKHSDDKAVTARKLTAPVAETVAPQLDGAKKSYLAIVQSLANNATQFQAKSPVQKPKYTGQPRAPAAPASVRNSEKKKDQKIIDEPGTSIFVANLPMNAMPPQLYELFKKFGPIKENGIQVRSSWASNGVCYGFVAFVSATSVQSVLQAAKTNPFMLADRKLRVKEKEVEYNGSKPSKPAAGKSGGGRKSQNGSADGGDELKAVKSGGNVNGSADGGDDFIPVKSRRNKNGSADGGDDFKPVNSRKNQNGSVGGGDEFKPVRNRRNGGRNERRGDRKANVDNTNQKNSEGRAP